MKPFSQNANFVLTLFLALLLGACSPQQSQSEKTGSSDKPTAFRVALITPSSVNDSGWSAMAYEGLLGIKEELGAEIENVVASTAQEIRDAMRSYAQKGVNLIIGHGYEYNQHGIDIGKAFPNTVFASSSGDQTAENVCTFRFALEEGMFLIGYCAGRMTKTGIVGMVGGPEVPSIASTFDAFETGVKLAKPDARVLVAYTGSNDAVFKAKQQTLAFIDQGADFIVHQANAAAQAVFEACRERGILAFGTNSDQSSAAPDVVLGSAVIYAKPVFIELAREVKEGKFQAGVRTRGMMDGAVQVVWNESLKSRISEVILNEIETLSQEIKEGQFKVPMRKF